MTKTVQQQENFLNFETIIRDEQRDETFKVEFFRDVRQRLEKMNFPTNNRF